MKEHQPGGLEEQVGLFHGCVTLLCDLGQVMSHNFSVPQFTIGQAYTMPVGQDGLSETNKP